MLAPFIEAALRSLILAAAVWAGLRLFRVRSVVSQRWAWTAVLACSLLMPVALPVASHWRALSIATIPAPATLNRLESKLEPAHPAQPSTIYLSPPTVRRSPSTVPRPPLSRLRPLPPLKLLRAQRFPRSTGSSWPISSLPRRFSPACFMALSPLFASGAPQLP